MIFVGSLGPNTPTVKLITLEKKKYYYFQNANQLYSWCVWPRETNENHCKVDYCTLQLVFWLGETNTNHSKVDYGIRKTIKYKRTIDYCTIHVLRYQIQQVSFKFTIEMAAVIVDRQASCAQKAHPLKMPNVCVALAAVWISETVCEARQRSKP